MGDVVIRPVDDLEGFAACERLQESVWGFHDRDLVPRRMFIVIHKIGGLTLGAFDGPQLVAFNLGMPGWRDRQGYWHSHMLAVAASYRNRGLGRRLKLRQRDEALARGLDRIEWTFDPLEIKNSYFNLEILGATARRYLSNVYGNYSSNLQAGLPSDRLTAEWWLRSPRVVHRLQNRKPVLAADAPGEIVTRIEVPAEIYAWKDARDSRALEVQQRNRKAFEMAFAAGLSVVGFERSPTGAGTFLLGKLEAK